MFENKDFKVLVSMTEQIEVLKAPDKKHILLGGDAKEYSISVLQFKNVKISVEKVIEELKHGRCLGQIYNFDSYRRKRGIQLKYDWKGSSWIGIDIDDSDVDMSTLCDELLMTPTFSMTTLSHFKDGHRTAIVYSISSIN